jgi:hypothetical protein
VLSVTKNVVLVNMTPPTVLVVLVSELINQLVIAHPVLEIKLMDLVKLVTTLVLVVLMITSPSMVVLFVQKPLTE